MTDTKDIVSRATILIVDDLPATRKSLALLLAHDGYRTLDAANGADALIVTKTEKIDLVITDVLMPVMDGYEFVRLLRLDPLTSGIPVVFHTAHYGEREARALARTRGLADVLTKPASREEVLRIVGSVLSRESTTEAPPEVTPPTMEVDREYLQLLSYKDSERAEDQRAANARLRAMINIGLDFASVRDSDLRLDRLCAAVCDLFGATYITLGIVDRNDRTLRRFFSCGADAKAWLKTGDGLSGILATVVTERRTISGKNPGGDPASLEFPWHEPEVQTFIAAPIASPSHAYGWICLVGNDGTAFTDEDENLIMALAGQMGRIYALEHEILERKNAEEALRHERDLGRAAEARMRFALESANVGIWDKDYTTGADVWSETLEAHYGLKPGTFNGTFDAFIERIHPDDRESVLETMGKVMKTGGDFSTLSRAVWPDGTIRWLEGAGQIHLGDNGKPVRAIGISLDVTERRTAEEKYQQAHKMEAIGRLASGVAHDFNNLLTVILGFAELLSGDLVSPNQHGKDVNEIIKAAERASGLTKQLLAFSRQQVLHSTALDVNSLITDMSVMLERLIGKHIDVSLALAPNLSLALADRSQLEQVVMNLVVNARDAMPDGGRLTIETTDVELEDSSFHEEVMMKGHYVMLAVTDTGSGMTKQIQRRVFEPFFTTKEIGKGTGLGLSTTYGIVKQSKGYIWVYSEVGRGTTFKVYLPCADSNATVNGAIPVVAVPNGVGTVLLVEDEEGVRRLSKRILVEAGYHVLESANGDDAEKVFEQNVDSIDLVLTDVIMPGCGGPELLTRLRVRSPDVKVLYMSGYTDQTVVEQVGIDGDIPYIQKPFTAAELMREVREAMLVTDG